MKNRKQLNFWSDAGGFIGGIFGTSNAGKGNEQPVIVNVAKDEPKTDSSMIMLIGLGVILFLFMGGKR